MRTWLIALCIAAFAPLAFGDTYTVTSAADSGPGTLRQAILDANKHPGLDLITQTNNSTIVLKSPLPPITDPLKLGFVTGLQMITLDGRGAGPNADGLVFEADDCWVFGAIVGGFGGTGIVFRGKRGALDTAFIGVNQGTAPLPNGTGVRIEAGADAVIGVNTNVIVSNSQGHGVDVRGGADIRTLEVKSNGGDGVHVEGAASLQISGFDFKASGNGGAALSLDDVHDLKLDLTGRSLSGAAVVLRTSRNVELALNETGGAAEGVRIENSTGVVVSGSIQKNAADGVRAIDSNVTLRASVSANRGHGVYATGGTLVVDSVPSPGISANGGDGVRVEHGKLTAAKVTSMLNGGDGIALLDGTTASNIADTVFVSGNAGAGLRIDNSSSNTVSVQARDNFGGPVIIDGGGATGNVITGAAIDQPLSLAGGKFGSRMGRAGVLIAGGASNNRIATTRISFEGGPAVGIESGPGNRVETLDVVDALHVPIDLATDAQAAPVLERVELTGGFSINRYVVTGFIPGWHSGGNYRLDLYSSIPAEWHTVGAGSAIADSTGHFSATLQMPYYVKPVVVAATVTDAAGNTSEMSVPKGVVIPPTLIVVTGDRIIRGATFVARVDRVTADPGTRVTADWSAKGGDGSVFAHGSLVFEPGQVRKPITVDTRPMFNCTCTSFSIDLSNISGGLTGTGALVSLDATDGRPRITMPASMTAAEGDSTGAVAIALTRHWTNGSPITLRYHAEDGTAKGGEDFAATSGTLKFAADQRIAFAVIPILGDRNPESDETFKFVIDDIDGSANGGSPCVITLTDDDRVPTVDASASGSTLTFTVSGTKANESPIVIFDVVSLTPFGEEIIDHRVATAFSGSTYAVQAQKGPVEVRIRSDNARVTTPVVRFEQAADATYVVEERELSAGKTEGVRVARLTPADAAVDVPYRVSVPYGAAVNGTVHFNAGQTISAINVTTAAIPVGQTGIGFIELFKGSSTIATRRLDILGGAVPLLTVSGAIRDADNVCVTFDAPQVVGEAVRIDVRGDWQSTNAFGGAGSVTIDAGSSHGSFCTDHTATGSDAWLNFDNVVNARLSTKRAWIGIDPYTSFGKPPVNGTMSVIGTTVDAAAGYVDVAVTLSRPAATPYIVEVETVDGTAIAGRDYTPVVTTVPFAGGQTRAVVRVPIAASGVPPEGRYFFVLAGFPDVAVAGVVTIAPPGKGPSRRRT